MKRSGRSQLDTALPLIFYSGIKNFSQTLARRYSILRFTNLLLEGIASSVSQTFYKLYRHYKLYKSNKPYKPYRLYKPFTNLVHEGVASSALETFYKPCVRRYSILRFRNFLETLQILRQTF